MNTTTPASPSSSSSSSSSLHSTGSIAAPGAGEAPVSLFGEFDPACTHTAVYDRAASGHAAPDTAERWEEIFSRTEKDGIRFAGQSVPDRAELLGAFLRAGDLGFIYAPRGVGKTWLSLLMARAIGMGESLGEWSAGNAGALRVCYVDGEVNLPDAVERALLADLPRNVHWLHHETVAGECAVLNLAHPLQQEGLLRMLLKNDLRVLILDNLSCLFLGVSENEADAWEMVLPWLLRLRRHGITVICVAHAGRNGEMRGTSRREDSAHWVLKLEDAGDSESRGATFKSCFTKNRNARQASASCPPLRWYLETVSGILKVTCSRSSELDELVSLINAGLSSARELAEELRVSKGTISKWAHKAAERGLIRIENRRYYPV